MNGLCRAMGVAHVWAVLNAVPSQEVEASMRDALAEREVSVLGRVDFDPVVQRAGLLGTQLGPCEAATQSARVIADLEAEVEEEDSREPIPQNI